MTIKENLADVKNRIAEAAKKCGRDPDSIKLIAVSKTKSAEQIIEAIKAGQLAFGENYAQELRDKAKQISELLQTYEHTNALSHHLTIEPEWHFIGRLQKNKIKYVLPVAKWIHTVDSVELARVLNGWCVIASGAKQSPDHTYNQEIATSSSGTRNDSTITPSGHRAIAPINCLIEVNIANEPSKSGIAPENVFSLVEAFSTILPSNHLTIALKGLMCMPPLSDNPENSRLYFKKLKILLDEINSRNIYPEKLTELSMGMSHDFEVAIEEGATMVRVGTAIFSARTNRG